VGGAAGGALGDVSAAHQARPTNVGKWLVKSPKVYSRDSGLLHALLGISTVTELQGHPIAGASWEGFVVEQIAALAPQGSQIVFYRTASGAATWC
jgi:uncharacterized protein